MSSTSLPLLIWACVILMPRLVSGLSRSAMIRIEGGMGRAASLWRTLDHTGEFGRQEDDCMSEAIQISVFPEADSSR